MMPCVFTVAYLVKHQTLLHENRCLRALFFTLFLFLFSSTLGGGPSGFHLAQKSPTNTSVYFSKHLEQG